MKGNRARQSPSQDSLFLDQGPPLNRPIRFRQRDVATGFCARHRRGQVSGHLLPCRPQFGATRRCSEHAQPLSAHQRRALPPAAKTQTNQLPQLPLASSSGRSIRRRMPKRRAVTSIGSKTPAVLSHKIPAVAQKCAKAAPIRPISMWCCVP